jgi:hypothetical protein
MAQLAVRTILLLLVAFATAVAVRTAMWSGPILIFAVSRPSVRSECAAVRAGMTFSEVNNLFHAAEPSIEAIIGTHLQFTAKDVCDVQLDPIKQRVLSAQFREGTGGFE